MMKQGKRWITVVCVLVLLAAAGAGGFFLGRRTAALRYREEQELDILLNRSELGILDKIEGKIYVTGHKTPDADTVCSSIAYAALLNKLGYEAAPIILGPVNRETEYILKAAGMETPELVEDVSGLNLILVDHSDYSQSAEGLEDAYIIGIIDHHGNGTVVTGNQLIYDARPLGSTGTIIWIRYRNYGIEPDKQTALVMMGSVLSDTQGLKSNAVTPADREAVRALSSMAEVPDTDAFYTEMFKASLSYEGMTDSEIYLTDYKEYESGSTRYAIGCVNAYDEETAKDLIARMVTVLPSMLKASGMNMAFAQINIFHDDISISFIVPSDDAAREVIEAAFSGRAVYDGTAFRFEPGLSRRQVLVPAIDAVLNSYPKE